MRSDTFFCWMLPPSVQTEMSCVRIICVRTPAKCSKSSILFAISRLIVLSRTPDRLDAPPSSPPCPASMTTVTRSSRANTGAACRSCAAESIHTKSVANASAAHTAQTAAFFIAITSSYLMRRRTSIAYFFRAEKKKFPRTKHVRENSESYFRIAL